MIALFLNLFKTWKILEVSVHKNYFGSGEIIQILLKANNLFVLLSCRKIVAGVCSLSPK
jgi:hypothetical protein